MASLSGSAIRSSTRSKPRAAPNCPASASALPWSRTINPEIVCPSSALIAGRTRLCATEPAPRMPQIKARTGSRQIGRSASRCIPTCRLFYSNLRFLSNRTTHSPSIASSARNPVKCPLMESSIFVHASEGSSPLTRSIKSFISLRSPPP